MSVVSVDLGVAEIFKTIWPDIRSMPAAFAQFGVTHRVAKAEKAIESYGLGWKQLGDGWIIPPTVDSEFRGALIAASQQCNIIRSLLAEKEAGHLSSLARQADAQLKQDLKLLEMLVAQMKQLLKGTQRTKHLGLPTTTNVDNVRVTRLLERCKKSNKLQRVCGLANPDTHPQTTLQFSLMDLVKSILGPEATQHHTSVDLLWQTVSSSIMLTDPAYAASEIEVVAELINYDNVIVNDLVILYLRLDEGALLLIEGCARAAMEKGNSREKVMKKLLNGLRDFKDHASALPTAKQVKEIQKSFNAAGTKCSRGWDTATVDSTATGTSVYYDADDQLRA